LLLSIIIVNYKSAQLITNCVQSLIQYSGPYTYDIIVVDNDSKDNSEQLLTMQFPFIRWKQMGYNAGFARANNEGIRLSKGDIVLLLNPDTLITDHSLEVCLNNFISSSYVACGVQLLNEDGTPQISGNYAMKGGLNYLLPLPYTGALVKWVASLLSIKKPNVPNATDTIEVDWINGAFLMVKKDIISKAGLLDEDFFLYAEEAEWCSRLKKFGKLCIYGQCHIIHLQGEVSNDTFNSAGKGYFNLYDKKGLQIILSNLVRIRKEFGVAWFLVILIFYTATIPIFLIIGFIHNLFTLKVSHYFRQWMGFTKNVLYVWKLSGIILNNKPYFYKVL
jgi:GT2 family glycosyltransferase